MSLSARIPSLQNLSECVGQSCIEYMVDVLNENILTQGYNKKPFVSRYCKLAWSCVTGTVIGLIHLFTHCKI